MSPMLSHSIFHLLASYYSIMSSGQLPFEVCSQMELLHHGTESNINNNSGHKTAVKGKDRSSRVTNLKELEPVMTLSLPSMFQHQ